MGIFRFVGENCYRLEARSHACKNAGAQVDNMSCVVTGNNIILMECEMDSSLTSDLDSD